MTNEPFVLALAGGVGGGKFCRGLAADPVRVPWGNMYEFTLTATFVVVVLYLAMYKRFGLNWLAPVLSVVVLTVLMIDVLFLYEPVTPLRDALQSPWLIIHVVAAIIATGAFTMGGMCSALYLVKERALAKGRGQRGYLASVPNLRDLDRIPRNQLQRRTPSQRLTQNHPRLHTLSLSGTRDFTHPSRAAP